jgi:hypothetical protein
MSQSTVAASDHQVKALERAVAEQEAFVRRMIVRGTPSQAAEDRLRQVQQQLLRIKEHTRMQDR